jgi:hypothetical protein
VRVQPPRQQGVPRRRHPGPLDVLHASDLDVVVVSDVASKVDYILQRTMPLGVYGLHYSGGNKESRTAAQPYLSTLLLLPLLLFRLLLLFLCLLLPLLLPLLCSLLPLLLGRLFLLLLGLRLLLLCLLLLPFLKNSPCRRPSLPASCSIAFN